MQFLLPGFDALSGRTSQGSAQVWAFFSAKSNFTHYVATTKRTSHELVVQPGCTAGRAACSGGMLSG